MKSVGKKGYSYSFSREDISEMFKEYFERHGYKDVNLTNIGYSIDLRCCAEEDSLQIVPWLISATVDFEADEE